MKGGEGEVRRYDRIVCDREHINAFRREGNGQTPIPCSTYIDRRRGRWELLDDGDGLIVNGKDTAVIANHSHEKISKEAKRSRIASLCNKRRNAYSANPSYISLPI